MRNGLLTRYAQNDDGAAAVEFALVEPLFLSLIFAIGYAGVAVMLYCFGKFAHVSPAVPHEHEVDGELSAQPAE